MTCPLPNSEPQRDKETGAVVECMHRPCTAQYRCVFASYGRGKYICCSKPKAKTREELEREELEAEEAEFDPYGEKSTTRPPWVPPPPRPVDSAWTPAPPPAEPNPWGNNNWNQWANWNNNWGNYNGNWGNTRNWGFQNWNGGGGWGRGWNSNYGQQYPYGGRVLAQRRRKLRPQPELRPAFKSTLNPRPSWSTRIHSWPRKQKALRRKLPRRPFSAAPFLMHHPGRAGAAGEQLNATEAPAASFRSSWSHATKVLIYWCCTNQPCIYRDRLGDFCRSVLEPDLYTSHFAALATEQAAIEQHDQVDAAPADQEARPGPLGLEYLEQ